MKSALPIGSATTILRTNNILYGTSQRAPIQTQQQFPSRRFKYGSCHKDIRISYSLLVGRIDWTIRMYQLLCPVWQSRKRCIYWFRSAASANRTERNGTELNAGVVEIQVLLYSTVQYQCTILYIAPSAIRRPTSSSEGTVQCSTLTSTWSLHKYTTID